MQTKLQEKTSTPFIDIEALVNPVPQPANELVVVPDAIQSRYSVVYDEHEDVLGILEAEGFEPKVFCDAINSGDKFSVHSDKWDWIVSPIKSIEDIKQIPRRFLRGVDVLLKHNVRIDDMALAKPQPRESVPDVIKEEFSNGAKMVGKTFMSLALGVLGIIGGLGKGGSFEASSTTLVDIPDPVLLVKFNNKYIEIGRWE